MAERSNGNANRTDVEAVVAEFDAKKAALDAFRDKTKTLIEELLQEAKIRYQSVQARVKDRDKLREKYLNVKKDYRCLDDITDQVALRVITYYEDEADRAAEMIKREFDIDPDNSVDKRETESDRFGYYALNYVCKYLPARTGYAEYKKFSGVWCEIQVTSILRHAWSEIEHPWYDLRDDLPGDIKRRFARMAALLEVVESEFLNLRTIRSKYQRAVEIQVEAKVPSLPVDPVSVKSFVDQDPLVAEIDRAVASLWGTAVSAQFPDKLAELLSGTVNLAGMKKMQDLRESLTTYREGILEYVRRCREFWPEPKSPSPVGKGISILNLAMLLISAQGVDAAREATKPFGVNPNPDVFTRQVAVAKEIMAKYAGAR
jgi:putative GTP pyrophosphokinase